MQLFSNVLLLEDSTMILFFYFSQFPGRTWYSLPVAVWVCSFAVLGAIMRVTHFYLFTKESIEEPDERLLVTLVTLVKKYVSKLYKTK